MTNAKLIQRLARIKLSIISNAPDTLWMNGLCGGTICEELDDLMIRLGADRDDLQAHYDRAQGPAHFNRKGNRVIETLKLLFSAILMTVGSGCGTAPASGIANPTNTSPLAVATPTPSASPSPAAPVTRTVCGISFTLTGGQVFETSDLSTPIANGSYTVGGYPVNGFYFPPCNYTVLDGGVCQAGTNCGSGW